ncbi:MAG: BatD family protein [Myxococcota bacterium]
MRLRAAWAAFAAFLLPAPALASTPPCVARAELEPASAVVGQQVVWKVQIDSRDDVAEISWIDTPAFANIRTERLQGLPSVARTASGASSRYTTREEQRALFAERAGALVIRSSGLLCKLKNGVILDTPVPTVTLNVLPIPESDRPEDFTGVIGPLVLQTHVEPDQLALGSTIHVTVSIRGSGNLWDVGDLLGRWNPMNTDVFARKAQLELRSGSRLSVQRILRYDVVPRSVGAFAIPPIRLSYFDPLETRYRVARSSGIEVTVSPRQTPPGPAAEPDSVRPAANRRGPSSPSRVIPVLALSFAVAASIALWLWRRGARHRSLATPIATGDTDDDSGELLRALRSALASQHARKTAGSVSSPQSGSDSVLDDRPDYTSEAAELLETLERSRFDPNTEAPERDVIERALKRLGRATRGRS